MSRFTPGIDAESFKDKVVVITGMHCNMYIYTREQIIDSATLGGSNGIGAATVERLCNLGAKVVFGDIQSEAAEKQAQNYLPSSSNS
jgi:hypothetical protein